MQAHLNNNPEEQQHSDGEVISFYGDLVSINPEDVDFHLSVMESSTVLSYVNEHNESEQFTMMYAQEKRIPEDLQKEIVSINPQTQFMQIDTIEEFANYYDNGSKEMDREVHPVESVKMLAREDVLFYDVKEREILEVKEVQVVKEYVKLSEVGYLGVVDELNNLREEIKNWNPEEFKEHTGFQGNDNNIDMMKEGLYNQIRIIAVKNTGTTLLDTISMPAKKVTDLVTSTIEKLYNLAKDKDIKLEAEFECSEDECSITGFNLIEVDEKSKEATQENKIAEKVDISDSNSTEKKENIVEQDQNTQPFNSTKAANQTLEQLNLTDSSQNNEDYAGRTLADDYADMD